jgi:hypothetical protein
MQIISNKSQNTKRSRIHTYIFQKETLHSGPEIRKYGQNSDFDFNGLTLS